MASIRFRGDRYEARLRISGKAVSKVFNCLQDAQKWALSVELGLYECGSLDPQVTFLVGLVAVTPNSGDDWINHHKFEVLDINATEEQSPHVTGRVESTIRSAPNKVNLLLVGARSD